MTCLRRNRLRRGSSLAGINIPGGGGGEPIDNATLPPPGDCGKVMGIDL